jgi:hypothetical protein
MKRVLSVQPFLPMNNFLSKTLPLNQLDQHSPFLFTLDPVTDKLRHSIATHGILNPPIVFHTNNKYVPVTGRKRIATARQSGFDELAVWVLQQQEKCWHLAITDVAIIRTIHPLEIAVLFQRKTQEEQAIISADLGIQWTDNLAKKYSAIARFVRLDARDYFLQYDLSLRQLEKFAELPDPVLKTFLPLMIDLSVRPVEALNILQQLSDISNLNNGQMPDLSAIIHSAADLNRNQQIQHLKTHVFNRRYPILSETNNQLHKASRNLPKNIKVKWDHSLEKPGVEISGIMQKESDLAKLLSDLQKQTTEQTIAEILKIYKQGV